MARKEGNKGQVRQDVREKLRDRIETGLDRMDRDYLTVSQLLKLLPASVRRALDVEEKMKGRQVADRVTPYLENGFRFRKGQRSLCLCRDLSARELIRREAGRKPELTSRQLRNRLPLKDSEYLPALNDLLQSGDIACTLDREHRARIGPMTQDAEKPSRKEESIADSSLDREAFHGACEAVGEGRRFIRIHRVREYLQWPRERFDRVLTELRRDFTVQLHGGDPSSMTEAEVRDSYRDEQGRLYIALTWSGR